MSDGKIKINVLVVDDSSVARQLLVHLLESDPRIHVAGTVGDGQAAVDFVAAHRPDAVLMDIHMPRLDGFEATRRIMETQPVPIVICSATANPKEVALTFQLMEAGAVACVEKPVSRDHPDFQRLVTNLLQTVVLMSEVKVVRRWPRSRLTGHAPMGGQTESTSPGAIHCAAIGASTGGPQVLQIICAELPKDFPLPILVVQHIARGFLAGLVEWLNQTSGLTVQIASHGICPQPGHVYFAPDDFHMGLNSSGHIFLSRDEPENGLRPSVSFMFRTIAETCGPNAVAVLLSGMGKDGAVELKQLKDSGAMTIAQDRESSVVHGMPGEAIALGGVTHVLPADKIAGTMITSARHLMMGKCNPL
jgi:two-component system chemotaxis response regulator CheB